MKHPLSKDAHRPVLSCCVAKLASGPPARACFAPNRTSRRFAVRGSAQPGPCARRCSPPTVTPTLTQTVRMSIALALSRAWKIVACEGQQLISRAEMDNSHISHGNGWTIGSFVYSEMQEMLNPWRLNGWPVMRWAIHDHIWPKPPPCSVNVLLALFPLRSTLTAAAFRPGLLLGSGFGKFKAGALPLHRTDLLLISSEKAVADEIAMEDTAAAAIASIRLLKPNRWLVRLSGRVPPQLAIISTFFPLSFAFRVVFLASTEGRWNLCCRAAILDAEGRVRMLLRPSAARRTAITRPGIGPDQSPFHLAAARAPGVWMAFRHSGRAFVLWAELVTSAARCLSHGGRLTRVHLQCRPAAIHRNSQGMTRTISVG